MRAYDRIICKGLCAIRRQERRAGFSPLLRNDESTNRFNKNDSVLLDKQEEPVDTRNFGPVTRELRTKKFMKIISLAPEVL